MQPQRASVKTLRAYCPVIGQGQENDKESAGLTESVRRGGGIRSILWIRCHIQRAFTAAIRGVIFVASQSVLDCTRLKPLRCQERRVKNRAFANFAPSRFNSGFLWSIPS